MRPAVLTTSWTHLQALASQLRVFGGYRTLWLDEVAHRVVHSEPDELLEAEGLTYVDTVLHPDAETLAVVLGVVPAAEPEPQSMRPPVAAPSLAAATA
ncbi:MAG: hypothetical protein JKY37_32805 [Nannocystaceae bacterium]|nr:hypothetical protein [Nannocystaceae bacterium]